MNERHTVVVVVGVSVMILILHRKVIAVPSKDANDVETKDAIEPRRRVAMPEGSEQLLVQE